MDYYKSSEILKALANETRLNILDNLAKDGCNVSKIVETLQLPQSTISQHLSILRRCNIVVTKKIGYNTCYRIADEKVIEILKILKK
ncbi:MAG: metalloregulator ArsR/SmtB family transcription factor [Clostridiales bacterium]